MKKLIFPIKLYLRETDRTLWILCLALSALSILLIKGILDTGYDEYLGISRRTIFIQGIAVCLGVFCAVILSIIDYKILTRLWKLYVPFTYILMLLTFWIGVGAAERPDDKRWLVIPGINVLLQPAELLRISFILVFSYHIFLVHDDINRPLTLLGLLLHGIVPVLLLQYQGDSGSALIFLVIIVCMLFIAGINWKYIIPSVAGAAVLLPTMWNFILKDFHKQRILALFNQSATDTQGYNFQPYWAKAAFAFGGAGGKGLFGVSHTYVPEMHNDFIFSFLGESFGFVGCLMTILAISVMWIKILVIACKVKDIQGQMICVGVFAMLSIQSIINIGMNISLLPVIGNTLPFLSYGGSSVVTSYLGIGLVLSVHMHSTKSMFE